MADVQDDTTSILWIQARRTDSALLRPVECAPPSRHWAPSLCFGIALWRQGSVFAYGSMYDCAHSMILGVVAKEGSPAV